MNEDSLTWGLRSNIHTRRSKEHRPNFKIGEALDSFIGCGDGGRRPSVPPLSSYARTHTHTDTINAQRFTGTFLLPQKPSLFRKTLSLPPPPPPPPPTDQ